MNNDLISREALKRDIMSYKTMPEIRKAICEVIDNAPTVEYPFYQEAYQTGYEEGKNERPQGKWHDCIENTTLKARHGDYVLYKIDYLLDHLAREIYLLEIARRTKENEKESGAE